MEFSFSGILWVLVVLTPLIFVHELGHFWVARRNGVRVETFSIGFGPELFGWNDKFNTRWKISAIPLGGYVKMLGEGDFENEEGEVRDLTPEEQAGSFSHKTLAQRSAIIAAGPAANFLFAIVVLTFMFATVGTKIPQAAVGLVQPGSAAAEAGLEKGDLILSIDGIKTSTFEDMKKIVEASAGKSLKFEIERNGKIDFIPVTPKGAEGGVGRIGVGASPDHVLVEKIALHKAAWMGVERTYSMSWQVLKHLGSMIGGKGDAKELGGIILIAHMAGETAQSGVESLLFLTAILSINLGLINLFPIPMLDGGHLAFNIIEAIRGKPLNEKAQEYGFRFGLILVLLIMVFATWNDIERFSFNLFN